MSVIVRDQGVIKMYIKGADSIIIERLNSEQPFLKKNEFFINEFSKQGLRTLAIAMRVISEAEYAQIAKKVDAVADAEDRNKALCKDPFLLLAISGVYK